MKYFYKIADVYEDFMPWDVANLDTDNLEIIAEMIAADAWGESPELESLYTGGDYLEMEIYDDAKNLLGSLSVYIEFSEPSFCAELK